VSPAARFHGEYVSAGDLCRPTILRPTDCGTLPRLVLAERLPLVVYPPRGCRRRSKCPLLSIDSCVASRTERLAGCTSLQSRAVGRCAAAPSLDDRAHSKDEGSVKISCTWSEAVHSQPPPQHVHPRTCSRMVTRSLLRFGSRAAFGAGFCSESRRASDRPIVCQRRTDRIDPALPLGFERETERRGADRTLVDLDPDLDHLPVRDAALQEFRALLTRQTS
jgi:hypothetical protein